MSKKVLVSVELDDLTAFAVKYLASKGKSPLMAIQEELDQIKGEFFLSHDGSTIVCPRCT